MKVRGLVVIECTQIVPTAPSGTGQGAAEPIADAIGRKCLVAPIHNDFSFALTPIRHVDAELRMESRWTGPVFGRAQKFPFLVFALSFALLAGELEWCLLQQKLLVLRRGCERGALYHFAARDAAQ